MGRESLLATQRIIEQNTWDQRYVDSLNFLDSDATDENELFGYAETDETRSRIDDFLAENREQI